MHNAFYLSILTNSCVTRVILEYNYPREIVLEFEWKWDLLQISSGFERGWGGGERTIIS